MRDENLRPVSVDGALGVRLPWRMRYLIKNRVPAHKRRVPEDSPEDRKRKYLPR